MSIAVSLHIANKNVYIIGGGSVASRKATTFLKQGANLTIIAPQVKEELCERKDIHIMLQSFSWDDVVDPFMIYVATDSEEINSEIVKEAKRRGILCGCANQLEDVSFTSMMQEDYSNLQLSISTKGSFPYANKAFLASLQPQLEHFNQKSKILKEIRTYLLQKNVENKAFEALANVTLTSLSIIHQALIKQEKIIILAYHGVAEIKKVASDMKEMNILCEQASLLSVNAFISDKIIDKAFKKGYEVDSLAMITSLCDKLHIAYCIQPMLLSNGAFMRYLQDTYAPHILGRVLCDNMQDVQEIVSSLQDTLKEPLCLLYHKSELSSQLKQFAINAFSYDEDPANLFTSSVLIQPFSIFTGYHAHKDIELRWIPMLQKQGIKVSYCPQGLLSYEMIRIKFMRCIQDIV